MRIEGSNSYTFYPPDPVGESEHKGPHAGRARASDASAVSRGGPIADANTHGQTLAVLHPAALRSPPSGVSDVLQAACERVRDALQSLVVGIYDAIRGLFAGVANAVTRPGSTCGAVTETLLGTAAMVGMRTVSAAQTLIGCEPKARPLSGDEARAMRLVFGDTLDLAAIEVKTGSAGAFSVEPRPFTLGNVIYTKNSQLSRGLLAHELVHAWQNQHSGAGYMIGSVAAQYAGDSYAWQKGAIEGTPWNELNCEQQAQLIEDAYGAGYFAAGEDEGNRRFIVDHVDHTDYLRAALVELRAGRGA